jgi:ubiquinone biosynthesis protein
VLIKYRLAELIRRLGLERFLPFHWIPPGNPWHKEEYTTSQRTRMAMEELGTTFVKVGQILSTRNDVLSPDFTAELSKLQSSLTPLPLETIQKIVSDELGRPINEVFRTFDAIPLGVASIGQAHGAVLQDGTEVVVKVRKPGVAEQVKEDLEILRQMAENAVERSEYTYQYDLRALVEEISDTITTELDYIREGHSAEHFARFFKYDPKIHIPKILWQYTTPRMILMERIRGIGILDITSLDKAGFDHKDLAQRVVDIWLKMIFEGELFHADPHPGNLFVEADGRLGLVDFGMVGTVDEEIRDQMTSAIKAILVRDIDSLMDSIVEMGAITPVNSREKLRADMKHVMGHYPQITEFHLKANLGELFTVVRRNGVRLPANTFLLLKTMSMAQSLGKGLVPDYDFFQQLQPHVEGVFKKSYSLGATFRRLPAAVSDMAFLGAGLPKRLLRIVKNIERGDLHMRTDVMGLERHMEHLEKIIRFMVFGILGSAVILALAMLFLAFRISG